MGAGVSQKAMNGYYYRRLKKIQWELERAGVASKYERFQLFGATGEPWNIQFSTLRASNGETCGLMYVTVGENEQYGKNWDAEKGIARIKELYGKPTEVSK